MSRWIQGVSSANSFRNIGGKDGASPTASGIDHVGDVGFQVLLYSSSSGRRHIFFPRFFVRLGKALVHLIVAGEDAAFT